MSDPKLMPKLKLRPANDAELPFIHLLTTSEPYFWHTDGALISFRDFCNLDIKWYVAVDEEGEYYAVASLGFIDSINRSAGIGLVVVPTKRLTGIGKECLNLIITLGFKSFNLHRLWASVVEDNRIVWEGMKRHGWTICGHLKESQFLNGKWINRIMLELINKEG